MTVQASLVHDAARQAIFDNEFICGTAWFYEADGARVGPVTANRFLDLLLSKSIVGDTLVWRPGLPDWVRAASLVELREHLASDVVPLQLQRPDEDSARWTRLIGRLFDRSRAGRGRRG